jgi:hypothetical protein
MLFEYGVEVLNADKPHLFRYAAYLRLRFGFQNPRGLFHSDARKELCIRFADTLVKYIGKICGGDAEFIRQKRQA